MTRKHKAYLSTVFQTEYLFNHLISTENSTTMTKLTLNTLVIYFYYLCSYSA